MKGFEGNIFYQGVPPLKQLSLKASSFGVALSPLALLPWRRRRSYGAGAGIKGAQTKAQSLTHRIIVDSRGFAV